MMVIHLFHLLCLWLKNKWRKKLNFLTCGSIMQLQANAMLTGWEWIHWLVQGWWWLFSEVQMGQKDKTGLSAAGGRQGWGYLACVTTMVAEWSDGAWEEQMEGDEAGGKERGGRAQRHKQERYTRKGKTRGTRRLHPNTETLTKLRSTPNQFIFNHICTEKKTLTAAALSTLFMMICWQYFSNLLHSSTDSFVQCTSPPTSSPYPLFMWTGQVLFETWPAFMWDFMVLINLLRYCLRYCPKPALDFTCTCVQTKTHMRRHTQTNSNMRMQCWDRRCDLHIVKQHQNLSHPLSPPLAPKPLNRGNYLQSLARSTVRSASERSFS